MDYETATISIVTVGQAKRELARHGFNAIEINGSLVCPDEPCEFQTIASIKDGEVLGGAVLAWLGY